MLQLMLFKEQNIFANQMKKIANISTYSYMLVFSNIVLTQTRCNSLARNSSISKTSITRIMSKLAMSEYLMFGYQGHFTCENRNDIQYNRRGGCKGPSYNQECMENRKENSEKKKCEKKKHVKFLLTLKLSC